jgi:serine/threonine-protein kinase
VGATVYVTVSSGTNIVSVPMPNLIGLTREAARTRIENSNLALGNVTYVESDKPAGYVVWQSVEPNTSVEEHSKIYLQISMGPGGSGG